MTEHVIHEDGVAFILQGLLENPFDLRNPAECLLFAEEACRGKGIIVCESMEDAAIFKLGMELRRRPGLAFRAMAEDWDQQRINREV